MKIVVAGTLLIAIVANIFAIWPAITDAPWENDEVVVVVPTVDRTADRAAQLRCEEARRRFVAIDDLLQAAREQGAIEAEESNADLAAMLEGSGIDLPPINLSADSFVPDSLFVDYREAYVERQVACPPP